MPLGVPRAGAGTGARHRARCFPPGMFLITGPCHSSASSQVPKLPVQGVPGLGLGLGDTWGHQDSLVTPKSLAGVRHNARGMSASTESPPGCFCQPSPKAFAEVLAKLFLGGGPAARGRECLARRAEPAGDGPEPRWWHSPMARLSQGGMVPRASPGRALPALPGAAGPVPVLSRHSQLNKTISHGGLGKQSYSECFPRHL